MEPIAERPIDSPALPDVSEEGERDDIGENLCQPPLLPPSRPEVVPQLPGLAAVPEVELPRGPELPSELGPAFGLGRSNPRFTLLLELTLPDRATSRPFPIVPFDALPFDAAKPPFRLVPEAEKKC